MTEEEYKEDCRKGKIKAQKVWDEKYSKLKPQEVWVDKHGGQTNLTFIDWIKETDDEVKTKTTTFIFYTKNKGQVERMRSNASKSKRFFVVGGPFSGERITCEKAGENYHTYNCASLNRHSGGRGKGIPAVILLHNSTFKVKK